MGVRAGVGGRAGVDVGGGGGGGGCVCVCGGGGGVGWGHMTRIFFFLVHGAMGHRIDPSCWTHRNISRSSQ